VRSCSKGAILGPRNSLLSAGVLQDEGFTDVRPANFVVPAFDLRLCCHHSHGHGTAPQAACSCNNSQRSEKLIKAGLSYRLDVDAAILHRLDRLGQF
jgi:hypothetical protein